MALFRKKDAQAEKKTVAKVKLASKKETVDEKISEDSVLFNDSLVPTVLVRPHVTEKAAILTDDNVYTFVVTPSATKYEIKRAIKTLYKKTPVKVAIARKAGKKVMRRTGPGKKPGLKKAYVYMKKGDTIDIL